MLRGQFSNDEEGHMGSMRCDYPTHCAPIAGIYVEEGTVTYLISEDRQARMAPARVAASTSVTEGLAADAPYLVASPRTLHQVPEVPTEAH